MMLRGIIFDFDGVIANTEPLHYRALASVLAEVGVSFGANDYFEKYLGYDDEGVFRAVSEDRALEWTAGQISRLLDRKAASLERLVQDVDVVFPGAQEAVRRCAEVVPVGIASGALRSEIVRILDRIGLTSLFTAIVAAGETPAGKPAPDPYARAVAMLSAAANADADAKSYVAIEDSRWGLESARAAGLRTVAVAHTYEAGELGEADLIIPGIHALNVDALRELCA
jgi:beta-phosphoglucomutase